MAETNPSFSLPILVDESYDRKGDNFPGKIPECPANGCGFKCCKFTSGNYIVMYPGELEEQMAQGLAADHLEVIEDDYIMKGGKKVVCKKLCTAKDVKPLDCKIYPLWWQGGDKFITGSKCPLPEEAVHRHAIITKYYVENLIRMRPELAQFFPEVQMVGYQPLEYCEVEPESLLGYLEEHADAFLAIREAELRKASDDGAGINEEDIQRDLDRLREQLREEALKASRISFGLTPESK